MDFAFESGGGGVMPVRGTTDERLVKRSNNPYEMLKKEIRQHKKPIRYSHVETAQYEKMGFCSMCLRKGLRSKTTLIL